VIASFSSAAEYPGGTLVHKHDSNGDTIAKHNQERYMRKILLAGAGAIVAAAIATAPAFAEEFKATLAGSGSGAAMFDVQGDSVHFKLDTQGVNNVTMAHIHMGKEGENGPPFVWLLRSMDSPKSMNGTIAEGSFKASDLVGPMQGKSIADVVAMIKSGGAYVNVHTTEMQAGAVRGQLK
jgi:hypothetical protein